MHSDAGQSNGHDVLLLQTGLFTRQVKSMRQSQLILSSRKLAAAILCNLRFFNGLVD